MIGSSREESDFGSLIANAYEDTDCGIEKVPTITARLAKQPTIGNESPVRRSFGRRRHRSNKASKHSSRSSSSALSSCSSSGRVLGVTAANSRNPSSEDSDEPLRGSGCPNTEIMRGRTLWRITSKCLDCTERENLSYCCSRVETRAREVLNRNGELEDATHLAVPSQSNIV